jgi:hypothetical protein
MIRLIRKFVAWLKTRTIFICEFEDFDGEWKVRREHRTYRGIDYSWNRHRQHCPYLKFRVRTDTTTVDSDRWKNAYD